MKTKLKIPAGWRKLKKGTIIKEGDKYHYVENGFHFSVRIWRKVGAPGWTDHIYIRKLR